LPTDPADPTNRSPPPTQQQTHCIDFQSMSGLARAEPDWSLVQCQHAAQLPALRWKLANLETFRKRRPDDFAAQSAALDTGLGQS
ncbi:MAG TPA: hypothetical protein QF361_11800, partial [Gammaproteobacteria bacterium]|nr:hypothetical protein [Gammaproteobacteria bacterium]